MHDLAGGAEVVWVVGGILNSLEDADLARGIMAVIQRDGCSGGCLPVGADAALRQVVGHHVVEEGVGPGDHRLAAELGGHSKHETQQIYFLSHKLVLGQTKYF